MTTIVSRLYESADTANRVADTLREEGFPDSTLSVITDAKKKPITEAQVDDKDAAKYVKAMKDGDGRALFVCRAPFTPFGAARRAQEVADGETAVDAGVENENRHVSQTPDIDAMKGEKVLSDHPLMLTNKSYVGSGWSNWTLSGVFDIPLVKRRKEPPDTVIRGGAYVSKSFWPQPLLSNKPRKRSVLDDAPHMTGKYYQLISTPEEPKRSVMEGQPRISERFGWKTLTNWRP
jgi:hypothetical protein